MKEKIEFEARVTYNNLGKMLRWPDDMSGKLTKAGYFGGDIVKVTIEPTCGKILHKVKKEK